MLLPNVCMPACFHIDMHVDRHTGKWEVKRVSWLVGNDKYKRVERRAGGYQSSRHRQLDKLAGHPGGRTGKHIEVGEKIIMVDGTDSVGGSVWGVI